MGHRPELGHLLTEEPCRDGADRANIDKTGPLDNPADPAEVLGALRSIWSQDFVIILGVDVGVAPWLTAFWLVILEDA